MLENKVVVITGAARGLGKAMAEILAAKKARVVISGKNKETLEQTAKTLGVVSVVADVSKQEEIQNLAKQTLLQFGKIDMWINNAGVWLPRMNIEEVPLKRVHDLFEVNFFGTLHGSLAALTQMKKQGNGTLVNIISTSALQGRPLSAAYSATKHAIKGLTDSIRDELKEFNVKVIGVYPGGIKTHLFDEKKPDDFEDFMDPKLVAEKIIENLEKETPEETLILKREGQK